MGAAASCGSDRPPCAVRALHRSQSAGEEAHSCPVTGWAAMSLKSLPLYHFTEARRPLQQCLCRRAATVTTTMTLDPAVIKLLALGPSANTVSSAGGGGGSSASTFKVTSKLGDGKERDFFMKTGKGHDAEVMFKGLLQGFVCCRALYG